MKKVLIIANLFHAFPRIPGISTYLSDFDWQATIISPPVDDDSIRRLGFPREFKKRVKIIAAPYNGDVFWLLRRILCTFKFRKNESIPEQIKESLGITSKKSLIDSLMRVYQTFFAYPDTEKTWRSSALRAAKKAIQSEKYDLILSSSPFPTSHIVASQLKKLFGISWVADFRDPWTQNHNYPFGPIRRFFERKLEIKTIKPADAVIAASPAYANKLSHIHHKTISVITNGYDPATENDFSLPLTNKFTITYTGNIYTGKQDPEKFLIALKNLILSNQISSQDVEVRFFGARQTWLQNMVSNHGLNGVAQLFGKISREDILNRQKESQVLLLFNWEDPNEKGVYPLKFFEYLAAKRPILATGGHAGDDIEKICQESGAGNYAASIADIEQTLKRYYDEYRSTGSVHFAGNASKVEKYSYRNLAGNLAAVLNQISGRCGIV
ncbi:MAG: glycosyltransferase [Candidatus Margulisiibacteriota bacterium]